MCNTLPPALDSNGLVIVKLKRKMQYRVYVYFKSVLSDFIIRLLQFFLKNNNLYSPYSQYGVADSQIDPNSIQKNIRSSNLILLQSFYCLG